MTVDLTFDIADLLGNDFDSRRTKVWIETNIPGDAVADTAGNKVYLGDAKATVNSDGTGSFAGLIATNATGLNLSGPFQYRVWIDYPRATGQQRSKWTSGWFNLTATTDLADVVTEEAVPPNYVSTLTAQLDSHEATLEGNLDTHAAGLETTMDAKVTDASNYATAAQNSADDAAASATAAAAPTDTTLASLVPASSGSQTSAALAADYAPATGSSEYADIDLVQPRETSIVIVGPEFASVVGGSALTNTGTPAYISYWPMTKAGGLQLLGRAGIEPPTWATRVDKVRVRWLCTTGAGTGVPKLRVQVGMYRIDAGGDPSSPALPTSGDLTPALVSVANRVTTTEFGPGPTGWNIVANQKVNVLVGRVGSSSGDTASSTTVGITAIEVVWA